MPTNSVVADINICAIVTLWTSTCPELHLSLVHIESDARTVQRRYA